MINEIQIDNVAVIEHAAVSFTGGLNVLTGETGAGKSILIDSINAILGNRTSREIVRTGASKASIQAVFDAVTPRTKQSLDDAGIDFDGTLILSRDISADGKSVCRINGRPATAATVRDICQDLVNIHGQLDNQELLDPARHIDILDRYAGTDLREYAEVFAELNETVASIERLQKSDRDKAARMDLLRYQIAEIDAADLKSGEEEELTERRSFFQNAEKIAKALRLADACVNGDGSPENPGAYSAVYEAASVLGKLSGVSSDCAALSQKLNGITYLLEEAGSDLTGCIGNLAFSEEERNAVEERLDLLFRLKRKYADSVDAILEYRDAAAKELDQLEFSDKLLESLTERFSALKSRTLKLAGQVSQKRKDAFQPFESAIKAELEFLNMPSVQFLVNRKKTGELTAKGYDDIEFFISANAGETVRPLAKIASGGEMSRIMLAIKSVMAEKDGVPTLIFDEIDTGVSGRSAQRIGKKLQETSHHHQIICVTHSAQVAAFAARHLKIEKAVRDERTYTSVTELGREERVAELARIISGDSVTELALKNAEEILQFAAE